MIEFRNITKRYKTQDVVSNISFKVEQGSLVVLIGPSGCGKTTMLKMINRLIAPSSGTILLGGKNILEQNEIKLRRNMGYVIQQTGLFPHMTIKDNISIILKLQKRPKHEIDKKCNELMEMVGLEASEYLDRYPYQLSGGQQQRIGVARAFACDPDVILMDEPFSALDPITRLQLQDELAELNEKMRKTIVFVTHDMDEAIKIADKVCLINDGKIVQYDTVENIMKKPANDYVEEFIGRNRIWSSPEFIRASDIMIADPICARASLSVIRAIERMKKAKVDSLIVIDKGQSLLGVVYAKDLQVVGDKQQPIADVMRKEVTTVHPDINIIDILQASNGASSIPVVDKEMKLCGLITRTSLLTTLSNQYSETCEEEKCNC